SIAKPPVILPGVSMIALARDLPTSAAHQWNLTLEAEVMKDTVMRAGLVGTAGRNNESVQRYNANPISNYVWYKTSGLPLPTGFYRYQRDPDIPKHRIRWNYLYDLPVGRGKKLAGNIGPKLNRLAGGWQIAGYGTTSSRYWSLPTNNWGATSDIEFYGTKYKIS